MVAEQRDGGEEGQACHTHEEEDRHAKVRGCGVLCQLLLAKKGGSVRRHPGTGARVFAPLGP